MAKMTLLEIVQDILSDMDSDEVNSINDSVESLQVAQIVKSTYYNIIDGKDYPWLKELFQLNASGVASKPTFMSLPSTVIDLEWIKYNKIKVGETKALYKKIIYKTPEDFLAITDLRDSSASNVLVEIDSSGVRINAFNDRAPQYFTSFDDEVLVFDAYDLALEVSLQNSKTQCYGKRSVAFTLLDTFTPDMPVQMFTYLLAEAKSTCFAVLKQVANIKAEQTSVTQRRRMSQEAWKIKKGITYPNYGRK
jgi:hypothetical protein